MTLLDVLSTVMPPRRGLNSDSTEFVLVNMLRVPRLFARQFVFSKLAALAHKSNGHEENQDDTLRDCRSHRIHRAGHWIWMARPPAAFADGVYDEKYPLTIVLDDI